jgi:hypothetical protein
MVQKNNQPDVFPGQLGMVVWPANAKAEKNQRKELDPQKSQIADYGTHKITCSIALLIISGRINTYFVVLKTFK